MNKAIVTKNVSIIKAPLVLEEFFSGVNDR